MGPKSATRYSRVVCRRGRSPCKAALLLRATCESQVAWRVIRRSAYGLSRLTGRRPGSPDRLARPGDGERRAPGPDARDLRGEHARLGLGRDPRPLRGIGGPPGPVHPDRIACSEPARHLSFFRNTDFVGGFSSNFALNFVVLSLLFLMALYLQEILDFTPAHAGLLLMPNHVAVGGGLRGGVGDRDVADAPRPPTPV